MAEKTRLKRLTRKDAARAGRKPWKRWATEVAQDMVIVTVEKKTGTIWTIWVSVEDAIREAVIFSNQERGVFKRLSLKTFS
jgi:hypothetical protein